MAFLHNKTGETNEVETRPWSDLPECLLRYISDKLAPLDVPHFALVCKSWSLTSYPVYPIDRCPLLLNTNDHCSGQVRYYSPYLNKNFLLDTSLEISRSACHFCCSKDGYVLLHKPLNGLVLANPLTGSLYEIPPLQQSEVWPWAHEAADMLVGFEFYTFWGKPDENLEIFGISSKRYGYFDSKTWVYGRHTGHNKFFSLSPGSCLVKHREKIYCLGKELGAGIDPKLGRKLDVGIFDLKNGNWIVLSDLKAPDFRFDQSFLLESKGEIMCVLTRIKSVFLILRLNEEKKEWEKVENLGQESLFVGSHASLESAMPPTKMKSKVYLAYHLNEQPETVQVELRVRDGRVFFVQKNTSFSLVNVRNCANESTPCYLSLKENGEGHIFSEGRIRFKNNIWFDVALDSLT